MFKGYVGYGSTELINVARLVKYATEGGVPKDVRVDPMVGDYSDLAAALGDLDYRTALLDSPPWYDQTNPDSADFSGLLPLEITGLDGSTRTREVTEGLTDGGSAGRARAASRPIGVTVLAIGTGEASLDAGLSWLAGVLHPPCAGAPETCSGAALDLFSAAPVYCNHTPDPDAGLVTTPLMPAPQTVFQYGPGLAFNDLYDTYLTAVCGEVTVTATVHLVPPEGEELLGKVVVMELVDTRGTSYASVQADLPSNGDPVTLTVSVDPSPGFPADWQPVLRWYDAAIIWGGEAEEGDFDVIGGVGAEPDSFAGPPIYDGLDADGPWEPGLGDGSLLEVTDWFYVHTPELTTDECLSELRRSLRNVVTLAGPTVVEEFTLEDGTPFAAKVEWTWVATDPTIYGDTIDLLRELWIGPPSEDPPPLQVSVATTANTSLIPPAGPFVIDGVLINTPGQRILFKDQTFAYQNGIRVWMGPGLPMQRATDMNTWAEVTGALVAAQQGGQAGTIWECTSAPGGTLGSTAITFAVEPGNGLNVAYSAPGIQIAPSVDVDGVDVACPYPTPVTVLCGDDPDLPVLLIPPTPPILPDPGMPTVTSYVRREFQIPPEWSPQPGAALTMIVTNLGEDDYRGIRVRLWADNDPDFGVVEECDFQDELYITYLAAGQTVTIDGPNQRVTTTCVTGLDADHERNMRGAYGGPFAFPQLRCGDRYHVAIDVPNDVDPEGVAVSLAVTRRGI